MAKQVALLGESHIPQVKTGPSVGMTMENLRGGLERFKSPGEARPYAFNLYPEEPASLRLNGCCKSRSLSFRNPTRSAYPSVKAATGLPP